MMNRHTSVLLNCLLASSFFLIMPGCTLKASTESLTDATTNFLSSTTPGAWFSVDGLLKPSERVNAFLVTNYENLQQDMARGEGEYLTAFGTLTNIPAEEMTSFKTHAQEQFQRLYALDQVTPQMFIEMASTVK